MEEFRYSATAPTLQRARDITMDAIDDFKSGKLDEIYLCLTTRIENAIDQRAHHGASAAAGPRASAACPGRASVIPAARWSCSRRLTVFEQTAPIYMHGMIFVP